MASRRAAVVNDTDVCLLNNPSANLKYRSHPSITPTVIYVFFLVVSEVTSKLEVDVSQKCRSIPIIGPIRFSRSGEKGLSSFKHLNAARKLQETTFVDGNLTCAILAVPVDIKLYPGVSCVNAPMHSPIFSNRTVQPGRTLEAGSLQIGDIYRDHPNLLSIFRAFQS